MALDTGVDIVMLDNFDARMLKQANEIERAAKFEVSGNVTIDKVSELRLANIDFISTGDLTKNCIAVDLSMRFSE